ncbi:hypothetical protein SLW73_04015 [Glutamicibacter protophormiae]|uniref:hypothetical protein n=1 Tax=Glutamicibacter protophormiae TaxID=37930 RepID=UPI002A7F588A|nr:hypothetical protein [Glutamicibacter protophormiae]WPR65498.1 hypothetical protein SLW72_04015 [Glutamicibacter protophormiae]WPR68996.1 hypothetical protein SLW73_04015 [Glutamicibacter protophormiae]
MAADPRQQSAHQMQNAPLSNPERTQLDLRNLTHHYPILKGNKTMENNMINFAGNTNNNQNESDELHMNYNIEDRLDQTHTITPRLRGITRAIRKHNLKAPKILTEDLITNQQQAAARVRDLAPAANIPNLEAAAQAIIAGEDPSEHMANYAAWYGIHALTEQIVTTARAQFIDALNEHADDLTEQVRRTIFEPALRRLKALIEKHPGKNWDLEAAVQNKDYAHAQLIDKNQDIAEQLDQAYMLRAMFYNSNAFTTPAAVVTTAGYKGSTNTASLQWWAMTIGNGHTAHLPTATAWEDLHNSKEHAEARKADAEALAADQPEAQVVQTLMHEGRMMSR